MYHTHAVYKHLRVYMLYRILHIQVYHQKVTYLLYLQHETFLITRLHFKILRIIQVYVILVYEMHVPLIAC